MYVSNFIIMKHYFLNNKFLIMNLHIIADFLSIIWEFVLNLRIFRNNIFVICYAWEVFYLDNLHFSCFDK